MNEAIHELQGKRPRSRLLCLGVSLVLFVFSTVSFWFQPDSLAPVTLVPAWCWFVGGVLLTILGRSEQRRRWTIVIFLCWCLFAGLFVEQIRSVTRFDQMSDGQWQQLRSEGRALRVVTLNCGSNRLKAAQEVVELQPDIVLFQESPSFGDVLRICKLLFGDEGGMVYGGDTSIIAAGKVERQSHDNKHFTWAKVTTPMGQQLDVVSARLAPPVFRLDFTARDFWSEHRKKRRTHRQQVLEILDTLQELKPGQHIIVGGDFNSPTNDAALWPLKKSLRDSFRIAGQGWGCTGTNDYPLFRVDQVWISKSLRPKSVRTGKTEHSDHRLVVCDLLHEM